MGRGREKAGGGGHQRLARRPRPSAFPRQPPSAQRPHLPSGQSVGRASGRLRAPLLAQSGPLAALPALAR